jgi:CDGSH-type Zn-finger protein/uncharacterized Fe-S cluster protein YjdI
MAGSPDEYHGERVTIIIRGERCIHSRNCVLDRPDVFVPNAPGAWVHPDNATPDEIAALAANCPSGAISYLRLDGAEAEKPPLVNTVHIRENGPLAFHAELDIAGDRSAFRATLCRCGASKNKPYCDNSHVAAGFAASGEPPTKESAPLARRDGVLGVTPAPNGPLLLQGAVEICSGTGRTVFRAEKTALCRCGASNAKPFCDGSHVRIGFTDGQA